MNLYEFMFFSSSINKFFVIDGVEGEGTGRERIIDDFGDTPGIPPSTKMFLINLTLLFKIYK